MPEVIEKIEELMEYETRKNVGNQVWGESFLNILLDLESIKRSPRSLFASAGRLYREAARIKQKRDLPHRELGAYLYFYATLIETFGGEKLTSAYWQRDWSQDKEWDNEYREYAKELADARRTLPTSGVAAKTIINKYRKGKTWGCPKVLE